MLLSLIQIIRGCLNRILLWEARRRLCRCGKNVHFSPLNSTFSYKTISVGSDVYIGPKALFSSIKGISIGNKVLIGPDVTIMAGNHNYRDIGIYMFDNHNKKDDDDLPVIIEDDVWIGCNVTILKGVTVGRGAIVGAGSVVTKNIPPYAIACGVPAKVIRQRFSKEEILVHEELLYRQYEQETVR